MNISTIKDYDNKIYKKQTNFTCITFLVEMNKFPCISSIEKDTTEKKKRNFENKVYNKKKKIVIF